MFTVLYSSWFKKALLSSRVTETNVRILDPNQVPVPDCTAAQQQCEALDCQYGVARFMQDGCVRFVHISTSIQTVHTLPCIVLTYLKVTVFNEKKRERV